MSITKEKTPELAFRVFNKYTLIGLKINEYWMQPMRAVYRDRSRYKPVTNQIKQKEKSSDDDEKVDV